MKCMLLAGLATALALSGCATVADVGGRAVDLVERICPPVQAVVSVLSVPGTVDPALEADLMLAGQLVGAVCGAGDLAQVDSLRDVLPVVGKLVEQAPFSGDEKRTALLGIAVAQAAIGASR